MSELGGGVKGKRGIRIRENENQLIVDIFEMLILYRNGDQKYGNFPNGIIPKWHKNGNFSEMA